MAAGLLLNAVTKKIPLLTVARIYVSLLVCVQGCCMGNKKTCVCGAPFFS